MKNKFFKNNEIVLKRGSIEIALKTNVPIVLCYHNIGDRIDDEKKVIHFHKKYMPFVPIQFYYLMNIVNYH